MIKNFIYASIASLVALFATGNADACGISYGYGGRVATFGYVPTVSLIAAPTYASYQVALPVQAIPAAPVTYQPPVVTVSDPGVITVAPPLLVAAPVYSNFTYGFGVAGVNYGHNGFNVGIFNGHVFGHGHHHR